MAYILFRGDELNKEIARQKMSPLTGTFNLAMTSWHKNALKSKTISDGIHRSPVDSHQKDSHTELWCFICCYHKRLVKQTVKLPVISVVLMFMWRYCNAILYPIALVANRIHGFDIWYQCKSYDAFIMIVYTAILVIHWTHQLHNDIKYYCMMTL